MRTWWWTSWGSPVAVLRRRRARRSTTSSVRAARVEVVDGRGRVRAVLGAGRDDPDAFGLWLRDEGGRSRLWLGMDRTGAALAVGRDGTVVAGIGTSDPGPDAVHVGAHLFIADRTGRTARGWYLHDDDGLHVIDQDEPP